MVGGLCAVRKLQKTRGEFKLNALLLSFAPFQYRKFDTGWCFQARVGLHRLATSSSAASGTSPPKRPVAEPGAAPPLADLVVGGGGGGEHPPKKLDGSFY